MHGFFRVFVGGRVGLCGCVNKNACIIFEAQTRLKFAAKLLKTQNVGFLLKHKSKNDKGSMRGDSRNDESEDDEEKQR